MADPIQQFLQNYDVDQKEKRLRDTEIRQGVAEWQESGKDIEYAPASGVGIIAAGFESATENMIADLNYLKAQPIQEVKMLL